MTGENLNFDGDKFWETKHNTFQVSPPPGIWKQTKKYKSIYFKGLLIKGVYSYNIRRGGEGGVSHFLTFSNRGEGG